MAKCLRASFVVGVILVFAGIAGAQIERSGPNQEQTFYNENNPIAHPASVPASVVKILLQRKEVKDSLNSAHCVSQADAVRLFRATEVHLGPPNETDLLVAGIFPVTGADNDWYWVVRSTPNPRVLLWVGCLSVKLLTRKTNGYRDVSTNWSSPQQDLDRVYRFDGSTYKLWKRTSEEHLAPESSKSRTTYYPQR